MLSLVSFLDVIIDKFVMHALKFGRVLSNKDGLHAKVVEALKIVSTRLLLLASSRLSLKPTSELR